MQGLGDLGMRLVIEVPKLAAEPSQFRLDDLCRRPQVPASTARSAAAPRGVGLFRPCPGKRPPLCFLRGPALVGWSCCFSPALTWIQPVRLTAGSMVTRSQVRAGFRQATATVPGQAK